MRAQRTLKNLSVGLVMAAVTVLLTQCGYSPQPYYDFGYDSYPNIGTGTSTWLSQAARDNGQSQEDYYMGHIGSETTCASDVDQQSIGAIPTPVRSFQYWTLEGYSVSPGAYTPDQWGQVQAENAYNCWLGNIDSRKNLFAGLTLFADVEEGNIGWYSDPTGSQQTDNQEVIEGFLDVIGYYTGVSPGLYEGEDAVEAFNPTTNWAGLGDPFLPFVWWLTGLGNCVDISQTGAPGWGGSTAEQNFRSVTATQQCTNGNYAPEIWQYGINPDPDITSQYIDSQTEYANAETMGFWDGG